MSVDGEIHPIAAPFMVLATQNPMEHEGVYVLPESQLDRFMLRLNIGYPGREHERSLLQRAALEDPLEALDPVTDPASLVECQRQVAGVHCDERLNDYILDVVDATRHDERVRLGASPRAALALARACRALALLDGRDYVRTDDVQELAPGVLGHRLMVDRVAAGEGGRNQLVKDILSEVAVP